MTEANESEIEWQVVHELLLEATDLLQPTFAVKNSRNSYLSIQMYPRMAGSIRRPYHGATQPHTPPTSTKSVGKWQGHRERTLVLDSHAI